MGRKKIWTGLVAVTENGSTQYGMTDGYDGMEAIALDLYENASASDGSSCAYFDRLQETKKVSEDFYCSWRTVPDMASFFQIFINIDADADKIYVDKKVGRRMEHSEYPLSRLVEQTGAILRSEPVTKYTTLKKFKLEQHLKADMQALLEQPVLEEDLSEKESTQSM